MLLKPNLRGSRGKKNDCGLRKIRARSQRPAPITSDRQHDEYLLVLDQLASKENPTREEERYAEVLMTLVEAYEEEHHAVPVMCFYVGESFQGCDYGNSQRLVGLCGSRRIIQLTVFARTVDRFALDA